MRVLVTGATGFVGKAVVDRLCLNGALAVRGAVRSVHASTRVLNCEYVSVGDIGTDTDWSGALENVDVVVHLAARAHVLQDSDSDPLAEFRRVNVEGALSLARQSIASGVKRFIFISSIGVHGGFTSGQAFTENSPEAPHADYAQSKQEAERALKSLIQGSGMELVVIRPPLVYAAHAPGNFRRFLKLVASGIPMPFGCVSNHRTMVALPNLVDFISACIQHPAAANETFLVSDSQSVSTGEMARLLSQGMGKTTMLLPVPDALIKLAAKLAGKSNLYVQLCCSLEVDNAKARRLLNWQPPLTAQAALVQAGSQYKQTSR